MAASRMDLQSCCLLLVLLFTVALAINREKVGMMMVMVVMMVMVMVMVMIGMMIMRIAGSTLIDYWYTLIKEKRSIIVFRVLHTSFLDMSVDSPCISTKIFNLKAESTQMDICMFVAYRSARAISFKAFHLFPTVALSAEQPHKQDARRDLTALSTRLKYYLDSLAWLQMMDAGFYLLPAFLHFDCLTVFARF